MIPVDVALARGASHASVPARPYATWPRVTAVVVAQFTVTCRFTRSVRYGARVRSEDEVAALGPAAPTSAEAGTAEARMAGKRRCIRSYCRPTRFTGPSGRPKGLGRSAGTC